MYTTRLIALMGLTIFAQSALANTIWLKDRDNKVCYNSLSTNANGIIGLGGINKNGTGFTLTISNPTAGTVTPSTGACTTLPKSDTNLVFTGGSVVPNNVAISRIGTGPSDSGQCLDQGVNLTGVTGSSSTIVGTTNWTLSLSYGGVAGCKPGTHAPPSNPLQRSATLVQKTGLVSRNVYSGSYYIFNVNAVPEPSTALLFLAGALGLGVVGLRRWKGARLAR